MCTVTVGLTGMAEVANTVTLQTFGTDSVQKSTDDGDYFFVRIEQLCTLFDAYTCNLDPLNDAVTGLPMYIPMTYDTDGRFVADYTITGDDGTISVSVHTGIQAEYWTNTSWSRAAPSNTRYES